MLAHLAASSFPFSRDESTQWVVLAAGVIATLYVIMRSKSGRRKVDPLARPATAMSLSQQRQVERDIGNLMVEMLETARQMTAQLDTRAARLEILIAEADQRLASLKSAASVAAPAAPPPASAEPAEPSPSDGPARAVSDLVLTREPEETPPDPRHAEIYALADQGHSTREIARSLDRPNGEVELILALRRP